MSIQFTDLETSLAQHKARFDSFIAIGRAIGSTLDLDEILRLVIDHASRVLHAERSTLYLVDPQRREIWSKIVQGEGLQEIRLPLGSGIAGWVCVHGKPTLVEDAHADPRFNPAVDRETGYRTRAMAVAPLRDVHGHVIGAIQALNPLDRPTFSPDDLSLLEAVAAQAGAAIENGRLFRDVTAKNRQLLEAKDALAASVAELDLLHSLEKQISAAKAIDPLLEAILATTMMAVHVDAASILTLDEESGKLRFETALGAKGDEVKRFQLRVGEGIAGEVVRTGEAIVANDAASHPAFSGQIGGAVGYPVRAVMCLPLRHDDQILGALELINPKDGKPFDAGERRIATLIAGQIARAIHIARDRQEGERKARLASIGQMISGMLHDLRTPMTVISGYAELMAEESGVQRRRDLAGVILKQLDHISAMAKETLAFARGESDILLTKVHLNKFVEEIQQFLTRDFEGKSIELEVRPTFQGTVRMDEVKMKRAIYNVARNAAQAMPNGGRFTFALDRENDRVVFRLSDTGGGIPDEIADKLFQSFVTSGKKDGTGLGLAIVKKVVEQHGGDVAFESDHGRGTTFTLRIPAQ